MYRSSLSWVSSNCKADAFSCCNVRPPKDGAKSRAVKGLRDQGIAGGVGALKQMRDDEMVAIEAILGLEARGCNPVSPPHPPMVIRDFLNSCLAYDSLRQFGTCSMKTAEQDE